MDNDQDKELLIEIQNIDVKNGDFLKNLLPADGILKIVALIKSREERLRLEARIDELGNVRRMWAKPGVGDIKFTHWTHHREKALRNLADLTKSQEKKL